MAVAVEKKKVVKTQRSRRGRMPSKRSINLAGLGEKPINIPIAVLGILLIVAAAVLFSKFLVIDRLAEMSREQGKVAVLQNKVDAGYAELANYDELNLQYAHYTYSAMTQEELDRADRMEVLDIVRRVVMPQADVVSVSITGNQMNIRLRGKTLQEINLIAQKLEEEERVNFCVVTNATSKDLTREKTELKDDGDFTGDLVVFLKPETEVNAK